MTSAIGSPVHVLQYMKSSGGGVSPSAHRSFASSSSSSSTAAQASIVSAIDSVISNSELGISSPPAAKRARTNSVSSLLAPSSAAAAAALHAATGTPGATVASEAASKRAQAQLQHSMSIDSAASIVSTSSSSSKSSKAQRDALQQHPQTPQPPHTVRQHVAAIAAADPPSALTSVTATPPPSSATAAAGALATAASDVKFSWPEFIEKEKARAAPVSLFRHVPLSVLWSRNIDDLRLEVPNTNPVPDTQLTFRTKNNAKPYWVAVVVQFAGYYAKMRYVGYEDDASHDFWMHMLHEDVHPVGWAHDNDAPLVPPNGIQRDDWTDYLRKSIQGFRTWPVTISEKVRTCF